jgi:hypothetical protein
MAQSQFIIKNIYKFFNEIAFYFELTTMSIYILHLEHAAQQLLRNFKMWWC